MELVIKRASRSSAVGLEVYTKKKRKKGGGVEGGGRKRRILVRGTSVPNLVTFPTTAWNDLPGLVVKRYRRSTHGRHKRTLIIVRDCPAQRDSSSLLLAVKGPRDLDIYKRRNTLSLSLLEGRSKEDGSSSSSSSMIRFIVTRRGTSQPEPTRVFHCLRGTR